MFLYVVMAAGAGVLGGILAFFWAPGIRARSLGAAVAFSTAMLFAGFATLLALRLLSQAPQRVTSFT